MILDRVAVLTCGPTFEIERRAHDEFKKILKTKGDEDKMQLEKVPVNSDQS